MIGLIRSGNSVSVRPLAGRGCRDQPRHLARRSCGARDAAAARRYRPPRRYRDGHPDRRAGRGHLRIVTDGDLIYIASAPETERRTILHGAMTLLAQDHATSAAALTAWLEAAYMLYQAPRRKRGGDAATRTFLITAGAFLLAHPPVLLHDVDLCAYVRSEEQFVAELRAAQDRVGAEP